MLLELRCYNECENSGNLKAQIIIMCLYYYEQLLSKDSCFSFVVWNTKDTISWKMKYRKDSKIYSGGRASGRHGAFWKIPWNNDIFNSIIGNNNVQPMENMN